MQTVWSRSIRPRISCRCVSCTNPLPSTLSRRTTTGIARKRVTAGDAFTLLLGPVLGSALIADVRAKDKRRKEWDEKTAAVRAEVDRMRRTGGTAYSIRSRNWRRLPSLGRNYSSATAAAARQAVGEEEDSIAAPEWPSTQESEGDAGRPATEPRAQTFESGTAHVDTEALPESKLTNETIEKLQRLQRLVALKLAIRMILHIHMGKSPRYINTSADYAYDQESLPQNANELIRHLKQVSNNLKEMNTSELRPSWRAYQTLSRGQTCMLDKDICHLVILFRHGEMNIAQLVEQFAVKLLSSSGSPTAHAYIPFLRALSRARFDELGFMVDGTLTEARLPCDRHAVFTLLWQYGKNKESQYFDKLLKKLTTDSAQAQYGEQWLWRDISGTLVPIPPSQDPQFLQILIYTALKCNQPHRAEAWSTVLAYSRTAHRWLSHVIRNFLKYYSAHKSWSKGHLWLQTALDRAEMLATQNIRHLQRVTFAMLEFCLAHEQRPLYRQILEAASRCHLGVYAADPDLTMTQRSAEILREWELAHEKVRNVQVDGLSSLEKARMFVHQLRHIRSFEPQQMGRHYYNAAHPIDSNTPIRIRATNQVSSNDLQDDQRSGNSDYEEASHVSSVTQKDAEAGQWRELCRQQQAQMDLLRRQVESLKSVSKSGLAFAGEHKRLPVDAVVSMEDREKGDVLRPAGPQPLVKQVAEQGKSLVPNQASKVWRPLSFRKGHPAAAAEDITENPEVITDQSMLPSAVPPLEARNYTQPEMCENIRGKSSAAPPEGLLPASHQDLHPPAPPPRTPTISEIERALNFCTCIINRLASHILGSPQIRPLHKLVSTLWSNFVVDMFFDGTFSHFIRQTVTEWEREVFWDNLTIQIRERNEKGKAASSFSSLQVEAEDEAAADSLPITRHMYTISPHRRIVQRQESSNLLPVRKVGYRALRI